MPLDRSDRPSRSAMRWIATGAAIGVLSAAAGCGYGGSAGAAAEKPGASRTGQAATAAPSPVAADAADSTDDPARYAPAVLRQAPPAGIDPQLLMAIVYNESYKPHDPASQRLWQALNPNASFGIVNMHQAAFDQARRGSPFTARQWQELPDDPELALQAAAWYLHDLARMLPAHPSTTLTHDQLLALGYNTGPTNMRLFARGVTPGPMAQTYLDTLKSNWDKAAAALATGAAVGGKVTAASG